MNWTTSLPFILDGVDGDMRLVYSPLGQKFYQNGREIKRSKGGFGVLKYKVETTDDGDNTVSIKGNMKHGLQVLFRGERINLEKSIGGLAIFLSMLPFIFIAIFLIAFIAIFQTKFGVIDAALLGGCGALGMQMITSYARKENDTAKLLGYGLAISIGSTVLFFILATIIGIFLGLIFGVAFSLF